MSRARKPLPPAAPLALALALAASACGGGADPSPECTSPSTCPAPQGACLEATCADGRCGTSPLASGTTVGGGAAGDCRKNVCDGDGAVIPAPDDTDLPADGNACTRDQCSAGAPSHPAEEAGTACAQDGGTLCDGAGACVQCLGAADCPGSDSECATRTCTGGACGTTFTPLGTPLAAQVAGDCRLSVCDGAGGTNWEPLEGDLPSDGNACTEDVCSIATPLHPPVAAGATCSGPGGGVVCDGAGACVQCLGAADCPGSDSECATRTCTAGACGTAFAPAATPVASQVAGDCLQNVCDGDGGIVGASLATDVPVDGDDCTDDLCLGGTPSNPPSAAGTACAQGGGAVCDGAGVCVPCNVGADCASRVCSDHVCQAATCTDLVTNGFETDVDCGGGTCPACADARVCAIGPDCTSGVCTGGRCQAPTCSDLVRNGTETDVDCGGGSCAACARGKACLGSLDCNTGNCQLGTCAGPIVAGVLPADGAADVPPATAITIFFAKPIDTTSVTAQASSGPCSGSVQLSADDFATCVGISGKSVGSLSATLQPLPALARATSYRIRTTTALRSVTLGAFEPFETPGGFTTAGGGTCGGTVVVSQIYASGGLTGASYSRDFVELHNNGTVPVSLDGLSVQYTPSASGYAWSATPLAGTLPPGGYFLVAEAGGAVGAPLPAPDLTGSIALSPAGGKVALVSTLVALSATCPTVGVLDLVGYGASSGTPTSCYEGSGPAPAPADAGAALVRAGAGCADGNGNAIDLVSQLVVPRNAASPASLCGCNGLAVNETGLTVELDWCNVQSPLGFTVATGGTAGPVYGRVYELGITEVAGGPPLDGELGYGPAGTDPRYAAGWTFVPAAWNAQFGNDDEFRASFIAPAAGGYAYVYRFSPDGQRWTYCDPNGAGSSAGSLFEPNSLPALTVTP